MPSFVQAKTFHPAYITLFQITVHSYNKRINGTVHVIDTMLLCEKHHLIVDNV